ncbi:NAD-dependent epimerase/dehydratase family protein [Pseudonocardia parietis]|uniref:dTDP-glucose 4,6-dehydratase n=1 Tax=Pseudonocardia parietis TaxID=570936 RepID=A0ABS4VVG6_9PSEU|nr:NAD-dependent epimerase/dehydratase family protein [Pseudonocardia parietis]MBP2367906.1 dTDP-glucose 4,6-dehydratase [Pseudonocardia parietis]
MTPVEPFDRAVVTGGAGFVGSHLCEALLAAGTRVTCLDDLSSGRRHHVEHLLGAPGFTFVRHDVTTPWPQPWPDAARPGRVLVAHLASAASPVDYHRRPLETLRAGAAGTEHALAAAHRFGGRFLLASTSEVYGDPQVHPQREDYHGDVDPVGPRSCYDEAKRYAEALTTAHRRVHGTDTAIARLFNTYGPRMRPGDGRMVPAFASQALHGEPITVSGTGTQTRSLCHVDDTVRGLLALATSDHPGPMNIGNPVERTVREVAELVRDLACSTSEIVPVPAPADDPRRRRPDIELARGELGWEPGIGLEDGLRRTLDWFVAQEAPVDSAV